MFHSNTLNDTWFAIKMSKFHLLFLSRSHITLDCVLFYCQWMKKYIYIFRHQISLSCPFNILKKKKTKNIRRVSNGNEFSFCVLDIIFFSSFVLEAKTFLINLFLLPKTGNFFFNFININHFSGGSLNAHERKPPKKKYCIWHGRKSKWNTAELFITKRKMS